MLRVGAYMSVTKIAEYSNEMYYAAGMRRAGGRGVEFCMHACMQATGIQATGIKDPGPVSALQGSALGAEMLAGHCVGSGLNPLGGFMRNNCAGVLR